jgi:hypothetical protein
LQKWFPLVTVPGFNKGVGKWCRWLEKTRGGKQAAGGRHKGRGDSERGPQRVQAVRAVRAWEKAWTRQVRGNAHEGNMAHHLQWESSPVEIIADSGALCVKSQIMFPVALELPVFRDSQNYNKHATWDTTHHPEHQATRKTAQKCYKTCYDSLKMNSSGMGTVRINV